MNKMVFPEYIMKIFSRFAEYKTECYAVGGCVRDFIIGRKINDYDMCSSSVPERTEEIFSDFRIIPTGIKHGTVTVLSDGHPVEITTFRTETGYSDNRHPDSVNYTTDIKKDLARRDFTMNALCASSNKPLIDLYDGINDINRKTIKCIGEPDRRFNEDALRMLRALRFSSQLDFKIDNDTAKSIHKNRKLIDEISAERIHSEINGILSGNCKCLFDYHDLLESFFGKYTDENILNLQKISDISAKYALIVSDENTDLPKKLKFSNDERQKFKMFFENKNAVIENSFDIKFFACKYGKNSALEFFKVYDELHGTDNYNLFLKIINANEAYSLKQLAVNGRDIANFGIHGKQIGILLNDILDNVIKGKIKNSKESIYEYLLTKGVDK